MTSKIAARPLDVRVARPQRRAGSCRTSIRDSAGDADRVSSIRASVSSMASWVWRDLGGDGVGLGLEARRGWACAPRRPRSRAGSAASWPRRARTWCRPHRAGREQREDDDDHGRRRGGAPRGRPREARLMGGTARPLSTRRMWQLSTRLHRVTQVDGHIKDRRAPPYPGRQPRRQRARYRSVPGRPRSRAIRRRWISLVPSPISRTLESR